MKHYDEGIIQLIQLYLTGDLSEEEKIKLEEWIRRDIARERLLKFVKRGILPVILMFMGGWMNGWHGKKLFGEGISGCGIHPVVGDGIAGWLP